MKQLLIGLLFITVWAQSQPISISLRDGKTVNTTITATSSNSLHTKHGSFALSKIDSVKFEVAQEGDKKMYKQLELAPPQLFFWNALRASRHLELSAKPGNVFLSGELCITFPFGFQVIQPLHEDQIGDLLNGSEWVGDTPAPEILLEFVDEGF